MPKCIYVRIRRYTHKNTGDNNNNNNIIRTRIARKSIMHFIITILCVSMHHMCVCLYQKTTTTTTYFDVCLLKSIFWNNVFLFCTYFWWMNIQKCSEIVCQCVNKVFVVYRIVSYPLSWNYVPLESVCLYRNYKIFLTFQSLFSLLSGLERVAEELMGRRKWKQYQDIIQRSNLNIDATNLTQKTTSPVGKSSF